MAKASQSTEKAHRQSSLSGNSETLASGCLAASVLSGVLQRLQHVEEKIHQVTSNLFYPFLFKLCFYSGNTMYALFFPYVPQLFFFNYSFYSKEKNVAFPYVYWISAFSCMTNSNLSLTLLFCFISWLLLQKRAQAIANREFHKKNIKEKAAHLASMFGYVDIPKVNMQLKKHWLRWDQIYFVILVLFILYRSKPVGNEISHFKSLFNFKHTLKYAWKELLRTEVHWLL